MIAVIDYGRGNLGSVEKAFGRLGLRAVVTEDPRVVEDAEAVVLPGDGAFHDAMESEEFGQGKGLDLIPGAVRRFPRGPKVPHMGWNSVEHRGDLALFEGVPSGAHFYFVHSYYPVTEDSSVKVATCTYGVTFAAAVERGPLFATQFHPEKSQRWGLRLLENFAAFVRDRRR